MFGERKGRSERMHDCDEGRCRVGIAYGGMQESRRVALRGHAGGGEDVKKSEARWSRRNTLGNHVGLCKGGLQGDAGLPRRVTGLGAYLLLLSIWPHENENQIPPLPTFFEESRNFAGK